MQRFTKAFLTTSTIIIGFINILLVLVYGMQFSACDLASKPNQIDRNSVGCLEVNANSWLPIALTNLIAVFLVIFFYYTLQYLHRNRSVEK